MPTHDEKVTIFIRLAIREGRNLSASYSGIVGLVVAYFRHDHQWSQKDLAEKSGVSQGTISRIELGQADITLPQMDAFATAFEVMPSFLLSVADEFRVKLEQENISVSRKPEKDVETPEGGMNSVAMGAAALATTGALLGGPVGLLLGSAIGAILLAKQDKKRK